MIGLTQRQQQCLDFLHSYHATHGIMPTMDEIAEHFGSPTRSMAARLLHGLEDRGRIRRSTRKARAIEFIDPGKMQAVLLSDEVFRLVQAYAAVQRVSVDVAVSEIVREVLETA